MWLKCQDQCHQNFFWWKTGNTDAFSFRHFDFHLTHFHSNHNSVGEREEKTYALLSSLSLNPLLIAPQFACRNKKTTVALSSVHFHSSHNSFDKKAGKLKGTFTFTQLTFTRTIFFDGKQETTIAFSLIHFHTTHNSFEKKKTKSFFTQPLSLSFNPLSLTPKFLFWWKTVNNICTFTHPLSVNPEFRWLLIKTVKT